MAYTEGGAAAAVGSGLTLSDVDSGQLSGASVTISSGYVSGDQLAATAQFGITVTRGANGSLALTGAATLAQYETVLQSVVFSSTSDDPTSATRTVSFTVVDSSAASSVASTRDVTVTPVNDAPSTANVAGTVSYTESGAAKVVLPSITVSDPDNTTLAGATLSFTPSPSAGDTLAFTDQNGITGSWNAGTQVLTLSGTATLAQYQAALRTITYATTSHDPAAGNRTVQVVVSDGALSSSPNSVTVNVTPVNDAPSVTAATGSVSYTEGGAAAAVGSGLTVTDPTRPTSAAAS